jgi:hypothetical protein
MTDREIARRTLRRLALWGLALAGLALLAWACRGCGARALEEAHLFAREVGGR